MYDKIVLSLPEGLRIFPPLVVFSILIAFYGIFIWLFCKFLARKDLIKMNLEKYNVFEHSAMIKIVAIFFYILEFIIIMPFVVGLWFSVLSMLLILMASEQTLNMVLLISASIIGAIRLTAYYNESLSKDIAKLFPFTLLSIAILEPDFFKLSITIKRFSEIPTVMGNIFYFLLFIVLLEIVLRLFYLAFSFFTSEEKPNKKKDEEE